MTEVISDSKVVRRPLVIEKPIVIVNLGCGATRWPGSIGVDSVNIPGFVDKVHNLDKIPYPFETDSVDEIHFYHVLEHLHDPLEKLEEIHRILKPGGILYMRVPHFSSMGAFTDVTHVRPFGYRSFDCLTKNDYHHFYTKVVFEIVEKRIKFFGLYPNYGLYAEHIHGNKCPFIFRPIVLFLDFLINLSPTAFERFWCYWVGGATEVMVTLRKPHL